MKKIVLPLIFSLIITGTVSTSAFAAETRDSSLPTGFITYLLSCNTEVRKKTNKTSVYINNMSGMSLSVFANGGTRPSDSKIRGTYSTGTTCGSGAATVIPGKYLIRTRIYEEGYRKAWLNITVAKYGVSGNCEGKWSPDSKGSFPKVN